MKKTPEIRAPKNLDDAMRIATEALDETEWEVKVVLADHRETELSWLFTTRGADGQELFGAPLLVVDKRDGEVRTNQDGMYEFVDSRDELTLAQRITRWWYRRRGY